MGNTVEGSNRPCNILIVGDWFVDEYWFLVRHYSDISSHVGPLHYRIYSQPDEYVKNLCGAGLVAQVLYRLREQRIIKNSLEALKNKWGISIDEKLLIDKKLLEDINDKEWGFKGEKFLYYLKKEIVYKNIFDSYENKILNNTKKNDNIYEVKNHCLEKLNDLPSDILNILKKMAGQEFTKEEMLNKLKTSFYELEKSQKYKRKIERIKKKLELFISKHVEKSYDLFGLGNWYKDDTEIIEHLIHARDRSEGGYAAIASFCIEPQKCKDKVDIILGALRPLYPTIRVIRQYNLKGNEFKQTNRIDWEPSSELLKSPKYNPEEVTFSELLEKTLSSKQIDAIVIEDHNKGVIEEGIIDALNKYSNAQKAKWYIRTKRKGDELKKLLERINKEIELLVLGPEVASRSYPCEALLVNKTKITRQAFDLIKELKEKYNIYEKRLKNIVLLSDEREVLAVLKNDKCIAGKSSKTPTQLNQVGWTTVLFASLTHEMYKNVGEKCEGKSIESDNIKNAINYTDKLGGVSVPESIRLNEESKTEESDDGLKPEPDVKDLTDTWDEIARKWRQAMGRDEKEGSQNEIETYGIITKKNKDKKEKKVLEVWRGSTDLPGYLVWVDGKRQYIKQIWQKLSEFKTTADINRHIAILLHADPAAGKSFLAEKLSDSIDFKFIQRDITQMIHCDDLLDLFDDIATAQAEKGSRVLVFVDEINARLEGNHVYGAFLTPIESGYYIRRGVKFKLKPCVWIFAGTKSASKEEEKKEEKLPDFKSRMTIIVDMDYKSLEEKYKNEPGVAQLKKEAKLEQVYIGAIKIRDHFPDVSKVSEAILKKFYELDPSDNPYREIRKLAASLQNVQYGIVKRKNCTSYEWKERLGPEYSDWSNEEENEKDFIELIFAHRPEKER